MADLMKAPATMSSIEIAELTGKRHGHVMRDTRKMLEELNQPKSGSVKFASSYVDEKGERRDCFNLPRRECLILVSGYSVELRARIIDRWEELENTRPDPVAMLNDPASMRNLLLGYTERVIELEGQVADMAPRVEAYDRIATADGSLCVTDAAKALQVRPKELFAYLRQHHWIYRRPGTSHDLGYQAKVQAGLVEHKVRTVVLPDGNERMTEQVRITPKGLTKLAAIVGESEAA